MTPEPVESWEEGKDIFIDPTDDSTTRIARPCKGCGHHQTIAGALLKSSYWREWYEHASKGMLYDVDETRWIDAMSDNHFTDFIDFVTASQKQKQIEEIVSMLSGYIEHTNRCIRTYFEAGRPTKDGYEQKYRDKWYESSPVDKTPKCDCGLDDILTKLKESALNKK